MKQSYKLIIIAIAGLTGIFLTSCVRKTLAPVGAVDEATVYAGSPNTPVSVTFVSAVVAHKTSAPVKANDSNTVPSGNIGWVPAVPLTLDFSWVFNRPMNTSTAAPTLNEVVSGTSIPLSLSWSASTMVLTATTSTQLEYSKTYVLKLAAGIKDGYGNGLSLDGDKIMSEPVDDLWFYYFTARPDSNNKLDAAPKAAQDIVSPSFSGTLYFSRDDSMFSQTVPVADGATGIPVNASFWFRGYDLTVDGITNTTTKPVGLNWSSFTTAFVLYKLPEWDVVASTNSQAPFLDTTTANRLIAGYQPDTGIRIRANAELLPSTQYCMRVDKSLIKDAAGNKVENDDQDIAKRYLEINFTSGTVKRDNSSLAGDLVRPTVAWANPELIFSELVDQTTLTSSNIIVLDAQGRSIPVSLDIYSNNGKTRVIVTPVDKASAQRIVVKMFNIKDLANNFGLDIGPSNW
jgi:hypothetical protein